MSVLALCKAAQRGCGRVPLENALACCIAAQGSGNVTQVCSSGQGSIHTKLACEATRPLLDPKSESQSELHNETVSDLLGYTL